MAARTRSVRAHGSTPSLVTFRRLRTITAGTSTMACRTGFSWTWMISTRHLIKARPTSLKRNMSPRANTAGARRIPQNATCITTRPIASICVSGTTNFSFSPVGNTVRMLPAIWAWAGATVSRSEPEPGNDGFWFMGYKVTNPSSGVWHYEYALYNLNLDRAIQSFSVPLGTGVNISNIGFHAPPQHPGWANDGTFNNQGYSSTPWTVTQAPDSITWNTETFAQNQNANAIRWGTLYNFRFDADQPPQSADATVGYFKTGSPMMVAIQAPAGGATPTPTPTPTATATPSTTPTATPRPTPTPRSHPTARPRPTAAPRP